MQWKIWCQTWRLPSLKMTSFRCQDRRAWATTEVEVHSTWMRDALTTMYSHSLLSPWHSSFQLYWCAVQPCSKARIVVVATKVTSQQTISTKISLTTSQKIQVKQALPKNCQDLEITSNLVQTLPTQEIHASTTVEVTLATFKRVVRVGELQRTIHWISLTC